MNSILQKLKKDHPSLVFEAGTSFIWSPKDQKVTYNPEVAGEQIAEWSLLHEVGHALLKHHNYHSDFELLQMEAEAWEKALRLAKKYKIAIDPNHIQDCLDTYRDWLHKRSTCPTCGTHTFQTNSTTYSCFNCGTEWSVSSSRICRPYRLLQTQKTAS